jgi:hypothetical protein
LSGATLLLGLLVVAYFGSMLLGGRALRGYGLPSGSEWLVLGFVLGPSVLGIAPASTLAAFSPLAGISMGWIALVLGAEYGYAGERRVSVRGFVAGIVCASLSALICGAGVFFAATQLAHLPPRDAALIGAGVGLCSCETARYAVRWAAAHSVAQGPLHDLLEDMADSDEIVPMLGVGLAYAFTPSADAVVQLTAALWLAIAGGVGIALALVCAMLLRGMTRRRDAWPVLVGAALLGTGVAWRLSLSPLTVMFVMGVTLCLASRHAAELRRMLARTEPAVLLPTLLLAGALVRFETKPGFLLVVGAALAGRVLARTLLGRVVSALGETPKPARWRLALGFWSTGALTTLVALGFAFRFPGVVGNVVLASAFCTSVLGELVGPASLARALTLGDAGLAPAEPAPTAEGAS